MTDETPRRYQQHRPATDDDLRQAAKDLGFEMDEESLEVARKWSKMIAEEIIPALQTEAAAHDLSEDEYRLYELFAGEMALRGRLEGMRLPSPENFARLCYAGYLKRQLFLAPSASSLVM